MSFSGGPAAGYPDQGRAPHSWRSRRSVPRTVPVIDGQQRDRQQAHPERGPRRARRHRHVLSASHARYQSNAAGPSARRTNACSVLLSHRRGIFIALIRVDPIADARPSPGARRCVRGQHRRRFCAGSPQSVTLCRPSDRPDFKVQDQRPGRSLRRCSCRATAMPRPGRLRVNRSARRSVSLVDGRGRRGPHAQRQVRTCHHTLPPAFRFASSAPPSEI